MMLSVVQIAIFLKSSLKSFPHFHSLRGVQAEVDSWQG